MVKIRGVTLAELVVVIVVFGLFIFAVYTALDMGLKGWQMGEVKANLYQKAQAAMGYIVKDFRYSTWKSAQIDNYGDPEELNEYICFESPVDNMSGSAQQNDGFPVWQSYVLYYIYPRWEVDSSPDIKRNLYRHCKPRTEKNAYPGPLEDIMSNIDITTPPSGDMIRTVAREIYSIDFYQKETSLDIVICFKKDLRENSSVMFEGSSATEVVEFKGSVIPKN